MTAIKLLAITPTALMYGTLTCDIYERKPCLTHRKQTNMGLENDPICTTLSTQSGRSMKTGEFPR